MLTGNLSFSFSLPITLFNCKISSNEYNSKLCHRYGLLGKKFKDTFGHVGGASLGGMAGLKKPVNHGVPYSLTEEFVSVYRMHSLLPDFLHLRNINVAPGPNKSPPLLEEYALENILFFQAS